MLLKCQNKQVYSNNHRHNGVLNHRSISAPSQRSSSPQHTMNKINNVKRGKLLALSAVKQQYTSFQDMIQKSELPILVEFYAAWCGPCQMMTGELETVQQELEGQIQVVKINSEKYPELSTSLNIQGLPTLLIFKKGEVVYRMEGYIQSSSLLPLVEHFINS
eukprot:TRINITY_DN311_c1_g1_i2.p1 TRINITY_DN311_c1_g1~~TRINITY_DN311_c1_g1_i2.p1  ORF type:complete len:162 (+),score=4.99 TRINITY_DN311_c1_g1_i2:108-593(+)